MEKLTLSGLTIEGYAQGGWRTSIHCHEASSTFDMGVLLPILSSNYFVTHAHHDHINAIHSIVARRILQGVRGTKLHIYVPQAIQKDVESSLASMDVLYGSRRAQWYKHVSVQGVEYGHSVPMGQNASMRCLKTYHIEDRACGWSFEKDVKKLKPSFHGLSGPEIAALRSSGVEITDNHVSVLLVVPGDTTIDFLINTEQAKKCKVLLHEVTYWDDQSSPHQCREYGHTHVDEMIEHCEKFEGEALVLVHRSMRYSRQEIESIVARRFPESIRSRIHIFDGGDI